VAVIADGEFSVLEKEMDVSVYQNGIYTVNYFVGGIPAKAELLILK